MLLMMVLAALALMAERLLMMLGGGIGVLVFSHGLPLVPFCTWEPSGAATLGARVGGNCWVQGGTKGSQGIPGVVVLG